MIMPRAVTVTPSVPRKAAEPELCALSSFSIYGNVKSRYVTDVLPLLPLLPPVNSSQGASQVLAFTEGVILTIYGR